MIYEALIIVPALILAGWLILVEVRYRCLRRRRAGYEACVGIDTWLNLGPGGIERYKNGIMVAYHPQEQA